MTETWPTSRRTREQDVDRRRARMPGLFQGASPEFLLVASCCHPDLRVSIQARACLDGKLVNWPLVVRLSRRHRVSGLVSRALGECEAVPAEVRGELNCQAQKIAQANLLSLATVMSLTRQLDAAGVPFQVLKGLPLGKRAYGNLTLRHSKDIDLLIAPECLSRAEAVLQEMQFARTTMLASISAEQERLWLRFRKHHEYRHIRTGVQVELHWRASDNTCFGLAGSQASLRIDMGQGALLPVESPGDLLMSLCLHGAGHAWFRLKWLADVAALSAQQEPGALAAMVAQARLHDLDRPLEQALLLCHALFPEACPPVAGASRMACWLARVGASALLAETISGPSEEADFVAPRLKRSRMMLKRSWRYRLEEARVQLVSPADWRALPWLARWQFLYPLLRLPLWAKRRWLPRERAARVARSGA